VEENFAMLVHSQIFFVSFPTFKKITRMAAAAGGLAKDKKHVKKVETDFIQLIVKTFGV